MEMVVDFDDSCVATNAFAANSLVKGQGRAALSPEVIAIVPNTLMVVSGGRPVEHRVGPLVIDLMRPCCWALNRMKHSK